jgi:tocopherol O-methyltransferase
VKYDLTIKKYYDNTRFDYRWVWNTRNTHALHFGFYDDVATHHVAAVANLNRKLADLAQIDTTKRVLDAGCGVGGSSIWLAKERGAQVVGITLVESQVKDAEKTIEKEGLTDKIQFQIADYCHTHYENASFDVVWAVESQCHARNKLDFYKEAYRLLKPGGRLVIADYKRSVRPKRSSKNTEGVADLTQCLVEPTAKIDFQIIDSEILLANWLLYQAMPDIDTFDEHVENALKAGFTNIDIQDVTPNVKQSLKNVYDHSYKWLGMARFLNRLGIVAKEQVGNAFAAICQYKAFERGYWQYVLISMEKK